MDIASYILIACTAGIIIVNAKAVIRRYRTRKKLH